MDIREIKSVVEALLFVAGDAVSVKDLCSIINIDEITLRRIVNQMIDSCIEEERGLQIIEVNDCYQLCTKPEHFEYIEKLVKPQNRQGLSQASMETLAIVAYKQPITKSQIDYIRGVKSESCILTLIEKELIVEIGRMEGPGRPILYGTTDNFLKLFGLKSLNELPALKEGAEEAGA
ncbi:MAG TPA: SMC-Scp complex subunit ScpB [Bacillota bacterium]|nr:SMC-Scp complex subunit ScpB [Bacillota bacterium]HOR85987.1 SMC-Scp complex subunit ScpB [Bacillota bacterium]HPL54293.1 SMC-Scp complex subunit ScpB [Bacillota bacterium]